MATRFYLSSTSVAGFSPAFDAGWADTGNWKGDRRVMNTTKGNSALTAETSSDFGTRTACINQTAAGRMLMRQYISLSQIGVFNFNTTTVSMVMKCVVTSINMTIKLNLGIRLLHQDNTLTTLLAVTAADYDTAFAAAAATRIVNAVALANVSSQNNDRLVVEIGGNMTTVTGSACKTTSMTDGDVSATADYALTSGLTTSLDPWIEFSGTLPAPATYNAAGQFLQFMAR